MLRQIHNKFDNRSFAKLVIWNFSVIRKTALPVTRKIFVNITTATGHIVRKLIIMAFLLTFVYLTKMVIYMVWCTSMIMENVE